MLKFYLIKKTNSFRILLGRIVKSKQVNEMRVILDTQKVVFGLTIF